MNFTIPPEMELMFALETIGVKQCGWKGTMENIFPIEQLGTLALQRLELEENQLSGAIPGSLIGYLTQLKWMDIAGNRITGDIPTEMGLLTSVFWLNLQRNKLSGSIPSEIALMKSLTYFYLYENNLVGSIPTEMGLLGPKPKSFFFGDLGPFQPNWHY